MTDDPCTPARAAAADVSVGRGWSALVTEIFDLVGAGGGCVRGVKAKFGRLVVYHDGVNDDAINARIAGICAAASTRCDRCGAPASLWDPHSVRRAFGAGHPLVGAPIWKTLCWPCAEVFFDA